MVVDFMPILPIFAKSETGIIKYERTSSIVVVVPLPPFVVFV